MSNRSVFIFGAFRSGTTAFCHLLREASNASVFIEQPPKLCIEARKQYEGRLVQPLATIKRSRRESVSTVNKLGKIYIDKNPNYLLFAKELVVNFNCKLIYLHRDGRDVVRSMMDWHDLVGKDIFTLAEDGDDSERVLGEQFPWDYSLLRPKAAEPISTEWKHISRFEKCAWYWARYNEMAINLLGKQEFAGRIFPVPMSTTSVEEVRKAYEFIGLEGFDTDRINELLMTKINSPSWRSGKSNKFPKWQDWPANITDQFNTYALDIMKKLEYIQ